MNPLVKDMLDATIRNDVETRFLEDLFEHEVKCESPTHNNGRAKCTGDVAYLLRTCDSSLKVCPGMGNQVLHQMDWTALCMYCNRVTSECWTIRPI